MGRERILFAAINVVGGAAVLGSYIHGLATHPGGGSQVWGGVPDGLRPVYTVNMLLAAAGYFPLTSYVFWRLDPERVRVGPFGFGLFTRLYGVILLGSALWMPLTFALLESPGDGLWAAVRIDLAAVGLASLALLPALLAARPRPLGWHFRLALVGLLFFCIQTALLDATIWPAYFRY